MNYVRTSRLAEATNPKYFRVSLGEVSQIRGETRRSTRVPLKVVISAHSVSEPLTCDGETIVVNSHGALISSTVPLRMGLKLEIHVIITDKRASAEVIYVDAERPFVCGADIGSKEPLSKECGLEASTYGCAGQS